MQLARFVKRSKSRNNRAFSRTVTDTFSRSGSGLGTGLGSSFQLARAVSIKSRTKGENIIGNGLNRLLESSMFHLTRQRSKLINLELVLSRKVEERMSASKLIIRKARRAHKISYKSLIHSTLLSDTRLIEAHIDDCPTDYDRVIRTNMKD